MISHGKILLSENITTDETDVPNGDQSKEGICAQKIIPLRPGRVIFNSIAIELTVDEKALLLLE